MNFSMRVGSLTGPTTSAPVRWGRLHDLERGLIQQPVVVGSESDRIRCLAIDDSCHCL